MSAVRLQCLRYLHSARELFNERAEFLSVAFDGTRLGKKDVLQIALTSPDTGKAVFGPPQARGSIKGKGGFQPALGVGKRISRFPENAVFVRAEKK